MFLLAKTHPPINDNKLHSNVIYTWYVHNIIVKVTKNPYLKFKFIRGGTTNIKIKATLKESTVVSEEIHIEVIERIDSVLGFKLPNSVVVNIPRKYKLKHGEGNYMIYYWNFGNGKKVKVTTSPAIEYTYDRPGEYHVSIFMKNPVSWARLHDKVFVLDDGICDTPLIHRIFPDKISKVSGILACSMHRCLTTPLIGYYTFLYYVYIFKNLLFQYCLII